MDAGLSIDLRGRRALVTGGSRGVGRATALLLARAGADVGIGYLSRAVEADAVAAELRALGVRAFAAAADVGTAEGARLLFDRCREELGGVDIFVGNAGVWPPDDVPIAQMAEEQWARTMRANLDSIFHCVRLAAARIGTAGASCWWPPPPASAARRGTRTTRPARAPSSPSPSRWRWSWARATSPSTAWRPGWIDTEMVAGPMAGEGRARIEAAIPLRRIASLRTSRGRSSSSAPRWPGT
jgi:3-oxoacyl-[acyl-carrier protein] reductase